MKKYFLIFALCLPVFVSAQLNHERMFQAYQSGDLTYWGESLAAVAKDDLTLPTLREVANYEYGYIAWCMDEKNHSEAESYLAIFLQYIDKLEALGECPSVVAVYRAAYYAYAMEYNKWKFASYASKAISYANKAVELDAQNPLALSLKGNTEFYCPAMFGGSKKEALLYFKRSIEAFERISAVENNWNYIATMLCYAQACEKTGDTATAIATCKKILEHAPNFVYVRDVFYPQLLKK